MAPVDCADLACGRMRRPMRRAEAGDAPALLIDHENGIRRQQSPQRRRQTRQLRRVGRCCGRKG